VPLDTRRILQLALGKLAQQGFGMVCGLEVEFHIYRIKDMQHGPDLDPELAAWPGLPPAVSMIHPGYNLLAESWIDMAEEPLRIVQHTAQALGLPLQSLEIELGPSQVEAVFDATDALTAADNMVLFRNGVRQASAPRGLPRQLHVPPALSQHHVQRLAPASVAGGRCHRRQRVHARRARTRQHAGRRAAHAVRHRRRLAGRAAGACAGHGLAVHAHGQRFRAFPAQRAGAPGGAVGPRQPGRDAARGGRRGRWRHAHRKPHRRAHRPTPTCTWPRRSTPGSTDWRAG
jgi:hypothetical protein